MIQIINGLVYGSFFGFEEILHPLDRSGILRV